MATESKKPIGNLLDMMTPEHRRQAINRFNRRIEKRENEENRITSEMYLLAELGYYYGFSAIEAVRENRLTLEEIYVLVESARKVWYTKQAEIADMTRVAVDSSNPFAKKEAKIQAFHRGMRSYTERTKLSNG